MDYEKEARGLLESELKIERKHYIKTRCQMTGEIVDKLQCATSRSQIARAFYDYISYPSVRHLRSLRKAGALRGLNG